MAGYERYSSNSRVSSANVTSAESLTSGHSKGKWCSGYMSVYPRLSSSGLLQKKACKILPISLEVVMDSASILGLFKVNFIFCGIKVVKLEPD
ncbi:hypothetical protein C5167_014904 [Papaver somniferum]|uniref:Uncharacterized protein n=1 Tax=Papaver somniferum TaxID=3469 RepID=A0A4Y7J6H0_PAPSO|nr:hypothetical protein C5167_014904 [Papaver somniferum]